MRVITVGQDQLDYVGLLKAPAFGLLSQPDKVTSGLYYAFVGLHTGLSDFEVDNESSAQLNETLIVNLGQRGTYRFDYERIEWTLPNAGALELDASVLDRGDAWLRSTLPETKFQHHYYTYFAHCWIDEGTATDFLLGLSSPQLVGFGENHGTGLIFHVSFPTHKWSLQITVDHSNVIVGGLFVQLVSAIAVDQVPHQQTVRHIDDIFRKALAQLGLELVRHVG